MKLNKYQRAWINKLKSGKTQKRVGALSCPGGNCCLGVAVKECGEKIDQDRNNDDLQGYATLALLRMRNPNGKFSYDDLTIKGKQFLKEHDAMDCSSLTGLNDNTKLSHKKIGQFIDENRKAFFKEQ